MTSGESCRHKIGVIERIIPSGESKFNRLNSAFGRAAGPIRQISPRQFATKQFYAAKCPIRMCRICIVLYPGRLCYGGMADQHTS